MKVKIFSNYCEPDLEDKINKFLRDSSVKMTNIEFTSTTNTNDEILFSVLITYRDLNGPPNIGTAF